MKHRVSSNERGSSSGLFASRCRLQETESGSMGKSCFKSKASLRLNLITTRKNVNT